MREEEARVESESQTVARLPLEGEGSESEMVAQTAVVEMRWGCLAEAEERR